MSASQRFQVALVLFCHFTASLAALGMPPFFGLILSRSLQVEAIYLIGWFYIVPTICTALAGPWWGRFADHWGKKISLLRAQLGLALGFALAGLATDHWFFLLALMVQGIFGGTFAASNAYLGTMLRGEALARSLNLMQGSARAAMVVAPMLFGLLITQTAPLELYRYLAILPLLAALMLWLAPAPAMAQAQGGARPGDGGAARSWLLPDQAQLYGLQFAFAFGTVATFPYFVPYAQQAGLSVSEAGVLYAVPHLVYLLLVWPYGRWSESTQPLSTLMTGLGLLLVALIMQALDPAWPLLLVARLIMGVAMTQCFVALNRLMSQAARDQRKSGRVFGSLDSAAKWAGVAAGLLDGVASQALGLAAPFWLGAASTAICLLLMYRYLPGIPWLGRRVLIDQGDRSALQ